MDLKEAIDQVAIFGAYLDRPDVKIGPAFKEILAAAKRELERQEAERPKRATLRELEFACLYAGIGYAQGGCHVKDDRLKQCADILKALSEKVVPWLRNELAWGRGDGNVVRESPLEMLRALGEEP